MKDKKLMPKFPKADKAISGVKSYVSSLSKIQKKALAIASFLVLLSGGGFLWSIGPGQTKRDLNPYTVVAERGKLPGLVTASGELKAERSVNVSPERQGLLEEIYVKEGDTVLRGDLIAKMSDGDYVYRLNELKAQYEKEKLAYERRKELFRQGAISAEQYEEYKNRFLTTMARLNQREVEGDELMIRAPFSGVITTRYADPGAFVTPTTRASSTAGATSTSIVELSQGIEAVAKVPESDIGRILVSQQANIRVDAFPDERFKAVVSDIAPRAIKTNNVTSFAVKLSLINPPEKLRIGMNADIEFESGESAISTLVLRAAIVTVEGQTGVLTVGEDDQPTFQKVELGIASGDKTVIIEGVKEGELIFISIPPWANEKFD